MKRNTLEETYNICITHGELIPLKYFDKLKIRKLLAMAHETLCFINESKGNEHISPIFNLHYTIIHYLADALVRFNMLKPRSHQCLFAVLCKNNSELDWNFFEEIRIKRNRLQYYGEQIKQEFWKPAKFKLDFYIRLMKKEVEEKLAKIR